MKRIGIVNRGEPAVRFLNALDALQRQTSDAPRSVALYTDPDAGSVYVRSADHAVRIGAGRGAYLDAEAVVAGLKAGGCDGAWLGWGFASEDGIFARALEDAGITLLGPRPETMLALGDKIRGKSLAEECGVPVAPWAIVDDPAAAVEAAGRIGFPLLLKAAGGGGGRGIRRVDAVEQVEAAFVAARDEAARSFGDGGVFLEKLVARARHIEVQVLGDGEGGVRIFGVRDCSLQRRRQKVIEECPAPGLPADRLDEVCDAARRLAEAVRYRSAGTVEFLYDLDADAVYFLEVNTRLQVEHPVTEEVFGVDLVRAQIDLASGRPLPDVPPARGWAVEARVCAEDTQADFTPAPGRLVRLVLPTGPGLRIDTGFAEGDTISPEFDPLVAKVIAWGPDRASAIARLRQALQGTRIVVEGGTSNLDFLGRLLSRDEVRAGDVDTGFIEREGLRTPPGRGAAALAAAIDRFLATGDRGAGADRHRVEAGTSLEVMRLGPDAYRVAEEGQAVIVGYRPDGPYQAWLTVGGVEHRIERAPGDTRYQVDGVGHTIAADSGGGIVAPSAALVLATPVAVGDHVEAGTTVVVLESMKMEVRLDAPVGGVVRAVRVRPGDQVAGGQLLVLLELADDAGTDRAPAIDGAWTSTSFLTAAERLQSAFVGWDFDGAALAADAAAASPAEAVELLSAFADVAELFDRRPTRQRDGGEGATDAVSPDVWLETARERGPGALSPARRDLLARALLHHRLDELEPSAALDDALLRLRRAGAGFGRTQKAAIALVKRLDAPASRLLDRLTGLDPERFERLVEAADRARYLLVELPAHQRLLRRAEERAEALLDRLRRGEGDWLEVIAAPESLVPGFAPRAAAGDEVAAEGVARRLEWLADGPPCVRVQVGARPGFRVGDDHQGVLCVTARPGEVELLLEAANRHGPVRRLDLVLVSDPPMDGHELLEGVLQRVRPGGYLAPAWEELCLIGVSPGRRVAVRRFYADGSERSDRRDVMPSTARRLDLDRLSRFDFRRLPSENDVVLFLARAWENPDDQRLLAFGEIRSLERTPGYPMRLPDVERVFHAAIRAIDNAREKHDPRRRMQWNRIVLRFVPTIPMPNRIIEDYIERMAPSALGIGLEKVVVRARFVDPERPEREPALMDLAVMQRPGGRVFDVDLKPASHEPLFPLTPYLSKVVTARRRGLTHPYEIVRLLESDNDLPAGRFDEYDLDRRGELRRVSGRPQGGNTSGVVFGVVRSHGGGLPALMTRVLVLSDPTVRMGALAEPECRRIMAAFELAERFRVPLEWVAVSAGARIHWDSGTENLDWTARVLRYIVRFTQAGGEVNIIVPGICVGAQSYFNAEATMMMHTRGLLVMTDRGTMVLTGKRALDASGCVSAEDDLALGGYTAIMGPNGQAQAHARDLSDAYRLLYRYYALTYVSPGERRPTPVATTDPVERDITISPYPADLGHGFATLGEIFSIEHNPDRKRPFAVRPVMAALADQDREPVERWAAMHEAETVVVWESRIGGYSATLIGIENQPMTRLGQRTTAGPEVLAGGTLYPQASRKLARALNAASGARPVVVLANLSGFDGSPESLRHWQLEYGAEIGRAVVNFDGPIVFVVLSRYHGGAYVVFSKALNPQLTSMALEGSYASVIGGAPAAAVVFAGDVRRRAAELGGTDEARARATAELAAKFDGIHTVHRAQAVGSIDTLIAPSRLRPAIIDVLAEDAAIESDRSGSMSRGILAPPPADTGTVL